MEKISRKDAKAVGRTHYFTGKPCPNGHVGMRFVSTFGCVQCTKDHHARYRKNPQFAKREAEYKARYREENRGAINSYAKQRWENDPKARENNKRSKARNRDKINKRQRVANMTPEQIERQKASRRRTYLKFRHDRLMRAKQGTAKRRGAEGIYSKNDLALISEEQGGKCPGCLSPLGSHMHVDHVLPISRGGSNWPENIQLLCPSCNMSKSALTITEWFERDGIIPMEPAR